MGCPDEEYDRHLSAERADDLCFPRLSVADSPAHLPAAQPRQPARARLQGRRHDDDSFRHVRAEQYRSLPADARCDSPRAAARGAGLTRRSSGTPRRFSTTVFTLQKTATICPRFRIGDGRKDKAASGGASSKKAGALRLLNEATRKWPALHPANKTPSKRVLCQGTTLQFAEKPGETEVL